MRFEHRPFAEETRFVILNFFKMLLFHFVSSICRFKSEISLSFSSFDREDFVKRKMLTAMTAL